ncbi:MAG TPA: hypothetical protein VGM75_16300 [Pseudonocardiaceae bacterium]
MLKATKTTMIAGAAVVALVGIGGGVAFATSGNGSSTPNSTLTAATSATAPATPSNGAAKRRHGGLLDRAEHGQVTVRTKTGTEVVDLQRGQVTAVSPTSITVKSADGFTGTYVVDSTTKVSKTGQQSAIGSVANGDDVAIAAIHSANSTGNTDTAKHIGDHGTKPAKTTTH